MAGTKEVALHCTGGLASVPGELHRELFLLGKGPQGLWLWWRVESLSSELDLPQPQPLDFTVGLSA